MAKYSRQVREELKTQDKQMRLADDKVGEQILTSQALSRDRGTTAKEVVFNIGEWVHKTNVVDFRGVDVKRNPIPNRKRKSVEDLVDDPVEAQRVLGYIMGQKNKAGMHKITDFDSFKEAFRQEFMKEGKNSNARLWDILGGQDDLLLRLYAHTNVQSKITQDSRNERVPKLADKYHISKDHANKLFEQVRIHEVQLVQEGMLPVSERQVHNIPESISPTSPPRMRISQSRGKVMYQRTKPTPYTEPELRFLRNNLGKGIPTRKITAQFNVLFKTQRTQNSIYNKVYRLSKRGE
jgi:hypothetical protein